MQNTFKTKDFEVFHKKSQERFFRYKFTNISKTNFFLNKIKFIQICKKFKCKTFLANKDLIV